MYTYTIKKFIRENKSNCFLINLAVFAFLRMSALTTTTFSSSGEKMKAHTVLVENPEGNRPLGRQRRRWEDDIKIDLRGIE
jgi:hypothetical protein